MDLLWIYHYMKYVSSKFGEPEKRTSKIVLATSATTILLRINPSKKKATENYEKATKIGVINYTFKNTGFL